VEQIPPIIIDIEASGFSSEGYPIEVGIALEDGNTFCSLILPCPEWTYWDEEAEKVHRVARDILETYGKSIEEVATALNELLKDKTAYSDGWEVDQPWLSKLFWAANIPQAFRFSTLEMILNADQMKKWHDTKDEVFEEMKINRHRASLDAVVIQKTYMKTRN
jgi:hypothetical protein